MTTNIDSLTKSMLDASYKPLPGKVAESILRTNQKEKLNSIQESITDINSQIKERRDLSVIMLKELDKLLHSVDKIIAEVDAYGKGVVEYTDIRKDMLTKKFDLIQSKTDEKLNLWKDISALKKESREHLKELRELESKGNMLDDLLNL